jgi:hypothetical protein
VYASRSSRAAMYAPRGHALARALENRVIRAGLIVLVLFGGFLALPRSVSRQSQPPAPDDVAEQAQRSAGLGVVRDASAAPLRTPPRERGEVYTPVPGTGTRSAVLRGVRRATGARRLFRVEHLRVQGAWAYIRCEELGTGRQIAALLTRDSAGTREWRSVEHWSLWTEREHPYERFDERVRAIAAEKSLPPALFTPVR